MANYTVTIEPTKGASAETIVATVKGILNAYYESVVKTTTDPTLLHVETTKRGAESLLRVTSVKSVTRVEENIVLTVEVKRRPETLHTTPWLEHLPGMTLLETIDDFSMIRVNTELTTMTNLRNYLNEHGFDITGPAN